MEKYLIATHGELSKEFISTAELIIGSQKEIEYFCMTADKTGGAAEREIRKIFETKNSDDDYIVLTDIYGGSVANIFATLLMEGESFELITGVNLPMVLSLLLSTEKNIEDKINKTLEEAKEGIKYINEVIKNLNDEDDDLDDFIS